MGISASSDLLENSVAHVWIENPTNACKNALTTNSLVKQFATVSKPPELSSVPDSLWESFQTRFAPLVAKLDNRPLNLLNWLCFLCVILFFAGEGNKEGDDTRNEDSTEVDSDPVRILLLSFLIFVYPPVYAIILKINRTVDDSVDRYLTSEFAHRFRATGYEVEYETRYTNYCKPRGRYPTRVFVFFSVGSAGDDGDVEIAVTVTPKTTPPVLTSSSARIVPSGVSRDVSKENEGKDYIDSWMADIYKDDRK